MTNERYKLMMLCHEIARAGYHNPLVIFVSPPDGGKTDTIEMFLRDVDNVYVIPSSTETKQQELMKTHTKTVTYILDEPDDWNVKDLQKALMTLKHLSTGKIKPSRATSYSHGIPVDVCCSTLLFLNDEQFDAHHRTMRRTGILERALVIMSSQNDDTKKYVNTVYRKNKFKSGANLPHFATDDFIIHTDDFILLEDQETWIDKHFRGHRSKTIEWVCRSSTVQQFNEFKPFFLSYDKFIMINEHVKFIEE